MFNRIRTFAVLGFLALAFAVPVHAEAAAPSDAGIPGAPYGFLQTENGVMWSNGDGTFLKNDWLFFAGLAFHLDANGIIQVGFQNIGGTWYYLPPDGKITPGWHTVGNDTFYIQANGALAVNTVMDGKTIGAEGKVVNTPAAAPLPAQVTSAPAQGSEFYNVVQQIIANVTTPQMTTEQKLLACYVYVMDATAYLRTYETPSGDWTKAYAMDIYSTGRGNCYRYAAAFAYLARGLGYQVRVCTGNISAARGGLTPHGWVEINFGGNWLLFDPDMQDTSRGTNYFMVSYDAYPVKPLVKAADWPIEF